MRYRRTYPGRIRGTTFLCVIHVVQVEDLGEDDHPAGPRAGCIEYRFDRILYTVIELCLCPDGFADMAPNNGDGVVGDDRDDIDDESQVPGNGQVRGRPKEPGLDVVFHVPPVFIRMRLVPIEVNNQSWSDDETRHESRANQGPEHQGQKSGAFCSAHYHMITGGSEDIPSETPCILTRYAHALLKLCFLVNEVFFCLPVVVVYFTVIRVRYRGRA